MRTEVEEPSIGEKLLLAGLETCDKVGEERITLACRLLHLCPAKAVNVLWCLIFESQLLSRWLMSDDNKNYNDENDDDVIIIIIIIIIMMMTKMAMLRIF